MTSCLIFSFLADDSLSLPNQEDILHKLIPNVWAFLVQLLAFIVMVIIVIKFAYKPVKNYLKKREDFVADQLKSAKEKESLAQEQLEKSEKEIRRSRLEASQMVEQAKQDAKKVQEKMIQETEEEIARRKKNAEEEMLLEKKQAQEEIRADIIDVAFEASEALLKREVEKKDNQKFLDEFLDKMDEE